MRTPPNFSSSSIQRTALLSSFFALFVLAAVTTAATKKPPLQPINLNAANSEELQQVPGIGPATAEKILLMRKSYGAFKSVDDLLAIRGIGKKRLDKMRKYLIAGRSPAASKPAATGSAKPATCSACVKNTAAEAVDPRSILKPNPPSQKPADAAAPVSDEEPQ
jgi:competence ComEA-like helix-hairpin-helix protein